MHWLSNLVPILEATGSPAGLRTDEQYFSDAPYASKSSIKPSDFDVCTLVHGYWNLIENIYRCVKKTWKKMPYLFFQNNNFLSRLKDGLWSVAHYLIITVGKVAPRIGRKKE